MSNQQAAGDSSLAELEAKFGGARSNVEIMRELEQNNPFGNERVGWLIVAIMQYLGYVRWREPQRNEIFRTNRSNIPLKSLRQVRQCPNRKVVASGWSYNNQKRVLLFDLKGSLEELVDETVKFANKNMDLSKSALFDPSRDLRGIKRKIGNLYYTNFEVWWEMASFQEAVNTILSDGQKIIAAIKRADERQERWDEFLANPTPTAAPAALVTAAQRLHQESGAFLATANSRPEVPPVANQSQASAPSLHHAQFQSTQQQEPTNANGLSGASGATAPPPPPIQQQQQQPAAAVGATVASENQPNGTDSTTNGNVSAQSNHGATSTRGLAQPEQDKQPAAAAEDGGSTGQIGT